MNAAGEWPSPSRVNRRVAPTGFRPGERGFSLIEVMVAMVILAFALLGVMGMFECADRGLRYGALATRALALAESRLEAKRAAPWEELLRDDLDGDGQADVTMRDDGLGGDAAAGDGRFSACVEDGPIRLLWTVQPLGGRSVGEAGAVVIQARADYPVGRDRRQEVRVGTLRANPRYQGAR
ncbi:type IV pilus modification PilV family protein [Nitrospira sp. Kam-Ns4a]